MQGVGKARHHNARLHPLSSESEPLAAASKHGSDGISSGSTSVKSARTGYGSGAGSGSTHEREDGSIEFLQRKTSMLTFSVVSAVLNLLTTRPEQEKILSDGTEVPGTHKSCLAAPARWGNWLAFSFHHTRGSVDCEHGCSEK